jgi:acyl carrier protein
MQQQVIEEIAKNLGVSPQDIDLSSSLSEDLGLGPGEMEDLINHLGGRFKITFTREDIESWRTVNDVVETIEDLSLE